MARREIVLLREPEIRSLLDAASCIGAVEAAFAASATAHAKTPGVIHLDIPDHSGEIHIKAGYLDGGGVYALKAASSFPGNPALGLPASDGLVMVFDATTGAPEALLLDGGFITDLRTAAAGAVAAKHLSRAAIETVGVVGAGIQCRLQVELLGQVRGFRELRIWGRDPEHARAAASDLTRSAKLPPGVRVQAVGSVEEAAGDADVLFTVTASRRPLVRSEWLKEGSLVVAVGADAEDKRELFPDVLARADRVVADSVSQCRAIGEIHHAVAAGALVVSEVVELGEIAAGLQPGRRTEQERIVCDLTGLGIQDAAAAGLVLERARERGVGERFLG
ncbi:MAG TPA: ornithine cyclodeaminase family protein [Vicinamibacteria bacterium]|nr:ornithine cyclodeaminase family protein [Vicinamibacteria bacterium]